ncbi:hypothetical protein HK101_008078 [Irineochytrium annulatum]|nr:hypothetical protein HK101_008078 [Irineochytrium annulatum]
MLTLVPTPSFITLPQELLVLIAQWVPPHSIRAVEIAYLIASPASGRPGSGLASFLSEDPVFTDLNLRFHIAQSLHRLSSYPIAIDPYVHAVQCVSRLNLPGLGSCYMYSALAIERVGDLEQLYGPARFIRDRDGSSAPPPHPPRDPGPVHEAFRILRERASAEVMARCEPAARWGCVADDAGLVRGWIEPQVNAAAEDPGTATSLAREMRRMLLCCVEHGSVGAMTYLLGVGAVPHAWDLRRACEVGWVDVVMVLVKARGWEETDLAICLQEAVRRGHHGVVDVLMRVTNNWTALLDAALEVGDEGLIAAQEAIDPGRLRVVLQGDDSARILWAAGMVSSPERLRRILDVLESRTPEGYCNEVDPRMLVNLLVGAAKAGKDVNLRLILDRHQHLLAVTPSALESILSAALNLRDDDDSGDGSNIEGRLRVIKILISSAPRRPSSVLKREVSRSAYESFFVPAIQMLTAANLFDEGVMLATSVKRVPDANHVNDYDPRVMFKVMLRRFLSLKTVTLNRHLVRSLLVDACIISADKDDIPPPAPFCLCLDYLPSSRRDYLLSVSQLLLDAGHGVDPVWVKEVIFDLAWVSAGLDAHVKSLDVAQRKRLAVRAVQMGWQEVFERVCGGRYREDMMDEAVMRALAGRRGMLEAAIKVVGGGKALGLLGGAKATAWWYAVLECIEVDDINGLETLLAVLTPGGSGLLWNEVCQAALENENAAALVMGYAKAHMLVRQ